jgi:hypothetical protein
MNRMTILVTILLLVGATLLAAVPLMAQGGGSDGALYTVQAATATGGGYQLSSLAWQVSGTASGGNYSLTVPQSPSLRGSGCCCYYRYLPCILRH